MRIAFFDTKNYDLPAFEKAGKENGVEFRFFEAKLGEDTAELARGYDGVCVFVNDTVDSKVIEKLYGMGVKLVALRCAGYNNVDVRAAYGKVHVVHVPAYSPHAVAEHAFALLLTSIRRIHKAYNRTRDFNFSLSGLTGFELHGKTVGVIGTGRIGRAFIDIAKGFGMRVLAYDKFPAPDADYPYVGLETIFRESDVISLHCPLTEETHHMIGRESLGLLKKGVVIVNTSRGALVDAEALLEGIKNRVIGAALFTIGLFCICTFGFHLFTGKVCYVLRNDRAYALSLLSIWLGNLAGTGLTAALASLTRNAPALRERAATLCQVKLDDSLLSLFILGVFCNMFIYIAVEGYRSNPHELGKYLSLFFGVMVFILSGMEHCVADMFYFWMAGAVSVRALVALLVISLGNSVGGVLFATLHRLIAGD